MNRLIVFSPGPSFFTKQNFFYNHNWTFENSVFDFEDDE